MRILVTGGAGFIGSHLCDYLIEDGHEVTCVDDMSLGCSKNIEHLGERFEFVEMDILDSVRLDEVFEESRFECVFHMAANSDIQAGASDRNVDLEKTFLTTFMIFECMERHGVRKVVFASSSAIYGDLDKVLDENVGPLKPGSFYGAAKLASEGYITAFCENFGIQSWIFRFPNVVGERATHGVVLDFVRKLGDNPEKLVILGDGKQDKPYCYVKDIVEGILYGWKNSDDKVNVFNLGIDNLTTVTRIAEIVVEEMGLKDVEFEYTGGSRGWVGDVSTYQYDLAKIHELGWKAKNNSDEACRISARKIIQNS